MATKVKKPDALLIMDEVDSMTAGDRGGVADLVVCIEISKIPIFCNLNDLHGEKLKSIVNCCLMLKFSKPKKQQVSSQSAHGISLLLIYGEDLSIHVY